MRQLGYLRRLDIQVFDTFDLNGENSILFVLRYLLHIVINAGYTDILCKFNPVIIPLNRLVSLQQIRSCVDY